MIPDDAQIFISAHFTPSCLKKVCMSTDISERFCLYEFMTALNLAWCFFDEPQWRNQQNTGWSFAQLLTKMVIRVGFSVPITSWKLVSSSGWLVRLDI